MKRMLVLTSLSITAVFLVTTLASGQSSVPIRAKAKQVTAKTTPKRDRTRPYTFRTSGRVVPPPFCAAGVVPTVAGGNCVALPIICPPGTSNPSYCQRPPVCPPGTAPGQYCVNPSPNLMCAGGRVSVKFQKLAGSGRPTISNRRVPVRSDCSYRSSVTFRTRNPFRRGRFIVLVRFEGSAFLLPRSAPRQTVRAG